MLVSVAVKFIIANCHIGVDEQKGALKLLFQLLCVQSRKKDDGDFTYLIKEFEVKTQTYV